MAWQFRRSAKFGPFRLTATKTGLSTSIGVPGARVGVNTRGQVRRTVGIPGTGLYETEFVNPKARRSGRAGPADPGQPATPGPRARRGWGAGTVVLFLAMMVVIVALTVALAAR